MGVENTSAIIRLTYAFGRQAVATRIINGSSTLYYIHNDHLGSNSRMSTSAGSAVANSTARYTPFGDWRTEPTATLTDRGYTGHLHNNLGSGSDDLGLIYMNARYYLPASGRFISPDTLVPDKANPQSLNRYSYVANNPLLLVDESGHCWGFASGIRDWNFTIGGTTYGGGVNCANIDMALSIVQHPEATPTEKAQAGTYLGGWVVAGVSGTAGAGLGVCSLAVPCAAAAETALGIGTAACSDGDCTNEGQIISSTANALCSDGSCTNEVTTSTSNIFQRVSQFWTRITNFQGTKVYQRPDLIDPYRTNSAGQTSLDLMKTGRAPIGPDGNPINLHHMLQTPNGPIAEVTQTFHQMYARIIHINPNTIPSTINRVAFNSWRSQYWIERAKDFMTE